MFTLMICSMYTRGTNKLRDINIAADLQDLSIIQIYVYMYVIKDILKTSIQNMVTK